LTDGTVHTDHILIFLIEDGVDGNGGFSRLAIADNQFSLTPPNGN
jgi:hypothetical protein